MRKNTEARTKGRRCPVERTRKSEQLSKEQLALVESLWKVSDPDDEETELAVEEQKDKPDQ